MTIETRKDCCSDLQVDSSSHKGISADFSGSGIESLISFKCPGISEVIVGVCYDMCPVPQ